MSKKTKKKKKPVLLFKVDALYILFYLPSLLISTHLIKFRDIHIDAVKHGMHAFI